MKASVRTNLKSIKDGHEFFIDMGTWDALIIRNSTYNPITDEDDFIDTYRVTYRYPRYDHTCGEIILGEFNDVVRIETLSAAVRYFNRHEIVSVVNLTTGEEHA